MQHSQLGRHGGPITNVLRKTPQISFKITNVWKKKSSQLQSTCTNSFQHCRLKETDNREAIETEQYLQQRSTNINKWGQLGEWIIETKYT